MKANQPQVEDSKLRKTYELNESNTWNPAPKATKAPLPSVPKDSLQLSCAAYTLSPKLASPAYPYPRPEGSMRTWDWIRFECE